MDRHPEPPAAPACQFHEESSVPACETMSCQNEQIRLTLLFCWTISALLHRILLPSSLSRRGVCSSGRRHAEAYSLQKARCAILETSYAVITFTKTGNSDPIARTFSLTFSSCCTVSFVAPAWGTIIPGREPPRACLSSPLLEPSPVVRRARYWGSARACLLLGAARRLGKPNSNWSLPCGATIWRTGNGSGGWPAACRVQASGCCCSSWPFAAGGASGFTPTCSAMHGSLRWSSAFPAAAGRKELAS